MGGGSSRSATTFEHNIDVGAVIPRYDEFTLSSSTTEQSHFFIPFSERQSTRVYLHHKSAAIDVLKKLCASVSASDTDGGAADSEVWQRIARLIMLQGQDRTVLPAGDLSSESSGASSSSGEDDQVEAGSPGSEVRLKKSMAKIRYSLEGFSEKRNKKRLRKQQKDAEKGGTTGSKQSRNSSHTSSAQSAAAAHRGTIILLLDCARIAVLRSQAQDGNAWECLGTTLWYLERRRQVMTTSAQLGDGGQHNSSSSVSSIRCQIYEDVVSAHECFDKAWMERGVETAEDSLVHLEAMRLLNAVAAGGARGGGASVAAHQSMKSVTRSGAAASSNVFAVMWKSQLEEVLAKVSASLGKRRNNPALWFVLSKLLHFLSPQQPGAAGRHRSRHHHHGGAFSTQPPSSAAGWDSRSAAHVGDESPRSFDEVSRPSMQPSPIPPPRTATIRYEHAQKQLTEEVDWVEALGNTIECDPRDYVLWYWLIVPKWPVMACSGDGVDALLELFGNVGNATDLDNHYFQDDVALPTVAIGAERALPLSIAVARGLHYHHLHGSDQSLEVNECSRIRGFQTPLQLQQVHQSLLGGLAALIERTIRTEPVALESTIVTYPELLWLSLGPAKVIDEPSMSTSFSSHAEKAAHISPGLLHWAETSFHQAVLLKKDVPIGGSIDAQLALLSITTHFEPVALWANGDEAVVISVLSQFPRRPMLWRYLAAILAAQDAAHYKQYWHAVAESLVGGVAASVPSPLSKSAGAQTSASTAQASGRKVKFESDSPLTEASPPSAVGGAHGNVASTSPSSSSSGALARLQRSRLSRQAAVDMQHKDTSHSVGLVRSPPPPEALHGPPATPPQPPSSEGDSAVSFNNAIGRGASMFFWTPTAVCVKIPESGPEHPLAPTTMRVVKVTATDCLVTSLTLDPSDPVTWYSLAQQLRRYDIPSRDSSSPATHIDRTVTIDQFGVVDEELCLVTVLALCDARRAAQVQRQEEKRKQLPQRTEEEHPASTVINEDQSTPMTDDGDRRNVQVVYDTIEASAAFRLTQLRPMMMPTSSAGTAKGEESIRAAIAHLAEFRTRCLRVIRCLDMLIIPSTSDHHHHNMGGTSAMLRAHLNTRILESWVLAHRLSALDHGDARELADRQQRDSEWQKSIRELIQRVGRDLFGDEQPIQEVVAATTTTRGGEVATRVIEWSATVAHLVKSVSASCEFLQGQLAQRQGQQHLDLGRALLSDVVQHFMKRCVAAAAVATATSSSAAELILTSQLSNALPAMDALLGQFARGEGRERSTWWSTYFENLKQRWLGGLLQCVGATTTATTPNLPEVVVTAAIVIMASYFHFVTKSMDAAARGGNLFAIVINDASAGTVNGGLWAQFVQSDSVLPNQKFVSFERVLSIFKGGVGAYAQAEASRALESFPQLRDVAHLVQPASLLAQALLLATAKTRPPSSSSRSWSCSAMVDVAAEALQSCVSFCANTAEPSPPLSAELCNAIVGAAAQAMLQQSPPPFESTFHRVVRLLQLPTASEPLCVATANATCVECLDSGMAPLASGCALSVWTSDALFVVGYMASRFLNTPLVVDVIRALRDLESSSQTGGEHNTDDISEGSHGSATHSRPLQSELLIKHITQMCLLSGGVSPPPMPLAPPPSTLGHAPSLSAEENLWISVVDCMTFIVSHLIEGDADMCATPPLTDAAVELVSLLSSLSPPAASAGGATANTTTAQWGALFVDALCVLAWLLARQQEEGGGHSKITSSIASVRFETLLARVSSEGGTERAASSSGSVLAMNPRSLHQRIALIQTPEGQHQQQQLPETIVVDTPLYCWSLRALYSMESASGVVSVITTRGGGVRAQPLSIVEFLGIAFHRFPSLRRDQTFGIDLWKRAALRELHDAKTTAMPPSHLSRIWQVLVDVMPGGDEGLITTARSLFTPTSRPTIADLIHFANSIH